MKEESRDADYEPESSSAIKTELSQAEFLSYISDLAEILLRDPTGKSDEFLESVGCYHRVACQKWLETFVNGSLEDFTMENRGGKHVSSFYEDFPELEMAVQIFATQKCQQKSAEFKLSDRPDDV
ncbi:unnamed protein product [Didymodactylos carnosus]|uniref:Uncharacterized protein n=1 Tax=Didymodactylos carnosus TaxID=1234261 RepID=A0A8S2Q4L9_9BILA|nr:unnamed protein product [Didymodactylos carnosus]CAF4077967.1 unnamed protein product [Didymodactylos carnosus]